MDNTNLVDICDTAGKTISKVFRDFERGTFWLYFADHTYAFLGTEEMMEGARTIAPTIEPQMVRFVCGRNK